jgi:hypothetical protein
MTRRDQCLTTEKIQVGRYKVDQLLLLLVMSDQGNHDSSSFAAQPRADTTRNEM